MKKKKLKKKIKELRREKELYMMQQKHLIIKLGSKISTLGDKYIKLREDFNDSQRQINELKSKISCHDNRLSILDQRGRIDYTAFSKKETENEEKEAKKED